MTIDPNDNNNMNVALAAILGFALGYAIALVLSAIR